jgi:hypothetical protein
VTPPATIIVQPIDAACVFTAPEPAPLATHPVREGERVSVPGVEWAAIGLRDAAWQRIADEVKACKAQIKILSTHLP